MIAAHVASGDRIGLARGTTTATRIGTAAWAASAPFTERYARSFFGQIERIISQARASDNFFETPFRVAHQKG